MTQTITHRWRMCDVVGCGRPTFVHDSCKRCRYRIPRMKGRAAPTKCARCLRTGRWTRPDCCSWCANHPRTSNVCKGCKGRCHAPAEYCRACRDVGFDDAVTI